MQNQTQIAQAARRLKDAAAGLAELQGARDRALAELDPEKYKPEHIERETALIREQFARIASKRLAEFDVESLRTTGEDARAVGLDEILGIRRLDSPDLSRTCAEDLSLLVADAKSAGNLTLLAEIRRELAFRIELGGDLGSAARSVLDELKGYEPSELVEIRTLADEADAALEAIDAAAIDLIGTPWETDPTPAGATDGAVVVDRPSGKIGEFAGDFEPEAGGR